MQSSTQPGDSTSSNHTCSKSNTHKNTGLFNRRKHIENKISDGDLKGAARLLFSSESLSPDNLDTLQALQTKHPPAPSTPYFLDPPTASQVCLQINSKETLDAIASFKTGSAAGLDGISPQHLKDLISYSSGDAGEQLLNSITKLINKMYTGNINPDIVPILFGANLIALNKKDGGVRPIAVGTTLRRLASKLAVRHIISKLKPHFEPIQLGFGTKGGCEAAVHSLRTYLSNTTSEVLIKIDVKNAFNSVNRDTLLTETKHNLPEIYNYLLLSYADPTKLLYRENVLSSEVGCQQGDPLGPAIFSLAINPIIKKLNSKFNVWYLDDGTLGGDVDTVLSDLYTIKTEFRNIGLELNFSKCELYFPNSIPNHNNIEQKFNNLTPNIKIVNRESLCLLGSPIFEDSFPNYIQNSISKFKNYSNRLLEISPHYAISILKFCLFVPKLTYVIRCSPIWKFENIILPLDDLIKSTLESILNIQLCDHSWTQASLPIRHGGLGIRKNSSVSLPAFLSSVHSSANLIGKIVRGLPSNYEIAGLDEAKKAWSSACPSKDFPTHPNYQRSWDDIMCQISVTSLLSRSTGRERARLLASASR
ncbi:uncharacterized protein LOC133517161 [Cydia pomonella]|uniref:uncharacterized protein LOC133517161 n=1 Tax=Cydia pomonella TaxID=82600 RepID=UPI002ADE63BB|nr:uncharacterized protein LOC133517161 [Cydia pomonella]